MKRHILPNRVFWRLDLATGLSREFKPRANGLASWNFCPVVNSWHDTSASGMLGTCASIWRLATASHPWNPAASPCFFAHIWAILHTLSHTLPLHDSYLNTGFLITIIQANLAWNKANKMVDQIQPYSGQTRSKLSQNNIFHSFTSNPSFSEIFNNFDQV